MTEAFTSSFSEQMESFVRFRKACQRWTNNSSYDKNLHYLDRHFAQNYADSDEITQEMIDTWCQKRPSENHSSHYDRIAVVIAFVNYLSGRGMASVKPPEYCDVKRIPYVPHSFTHEELARFFKACDNIPVYMNRKVIKARKLTVPVAFRLLYSTGMRTCEARELKRENVNLEDGIISITDSKGPNQHYVVLDDNMLAAMKVYDKAIEKLAPNRTYFFPSLDWRSNDGHLGIHWFRDNFKQLWKKANGTKVNVYDLRHNYAVENLNKWVGEGFDFFGKFVSLSKSMGHSSVESTKYYYSLVPALADILEDKFDQSLYPELFEEEVEYEESQ